MTLLNIHTWLWGVKSRSGAQMVELNSFSADTFRRQNVTSKDDPRTERIFKIIIAVDT